jgi:hypothetical protein
MDQEAARQHIRDYVLQSFKSGRLFDSAFDIAQQLDVPVTMVDQALHGFTLPDGSLPPYSSATEY